MNINLKLESIKLGKFKSETEINELLIELREGFITEKYSIDDLSQVASAILKEPPTEGFSNGELLSTITDLAELSYYLRRVDNPETAKTFISILSHFLKPR